MYTLNSEKMFYDMADGQAIVINFETGMYYGTTSLGSSVLDALIQGHSPNQIIEAIRMSSDSISDIEQQLPYFISLLIEKEVLVEDNQAFNSEPLTDFVISGADHKLELNEFAEVQDLLLADPVHDVEADMGWPKLREED